MPMSYFQISINNIIIFILQLVICQDLLEEKQLYVKLDVQQSHVARMEGSFFLITGSFPVESNNSSNFRGIFVAAVPPETIFFLRSMKGVEQHSNPACFRTTMNEP